jgi:hypothetical protein
LPRHKLQDEAPPLRRCGGEFSVGIDDADPATRRYAARVSNHYETNVTRGHFPYLEAKMHYQRHAILIERMSTLAWLQRVYRYAVWDTLIHALTLNTRVWSRQDSRTSGEVAALCGCPHEHVLSYSDQIHTRGDADRLFVVLYTPDQQFVQRDAWAIRADSRWANCFYAVPKEREWTLGR